MRLHYRVSRLWEHMQIISERIIIAQLIIHCQREKISYHISQCSIPHFTPGQESPLSTNLVPRGPEGEEEDELTHGSEGVTLEVFRKRFE